MHRFILAGWALTVVVSAGVAFRLASALRRGTLPLTPADSATSPIGPGNDRAFEDLLAEVVGVVDLIDAEPPAAADPALFRWRALSERRRSDDAQP